MIETQFLHTPSHSILSHIIQIKQFNIHVEITNEIV